MESVIVYAEKDRFAGWPANNGIWIWEGTEILVGFTVGDFEEQKGHNIREPYTSMLARSGDGGHTWGTEKPDIFVGRSGSVKTFRSVPGTAVIRGKHGVVLLSFGMIFCRTPLGMRISDIRGWSSGRTAS